MAPLPEELVATLLKGQWKTSKDEEDHRRRSIYLFVRRNLRYPLFDVFDRPDTNASCPRREILTTAPQALFLLNSDFSFSAARQLAGTLLQSLDSQPDASAEATTNRGIRQLYERTLSREPTSRELTAAADFLLSQSTLIRESAADKPAAPLPPQPDRFSSADAAAWVDLCLAIFNLNEFIYLD